MVKNSSLALMLGWQDVRQSYRRSSLGPFWITAGMAVQIASMGVVFSVIFKTTVQDYLPFLTVSIICWGFMSSIVSEGCTSFINASTLIHQIRFPLFLHVLRSLWKQVIIFGHNFVIAPFVFLFLGQQLSWTMILLVPGFLLVALNLYVVSYLLAFVSTRYRDFPQIISSLMTILYFITPVIWKPELIPSGPGHLLLGLNPFYHWIQILRLPLLGEIPTLENWTLSCVSAAAGAGLLVVVSKKFKTRIAYWV